MTKKATLPFFRTPFTPYKRVPFETDGETLTQNHFAEQTKIQNLLKNYDSQGFFDTINRNPAQYGDFTQTKDLHDAMHQIQDAQDKFMTIPSHIRERFQNDAQQFYNFASDKNNYKELVEMGLADPIYEPKESSPIVEDTPVIPSEESDNIPKKE